MWKSHDYAKQYWRDYYLNNEKAIKEKRKKYRQVHKKRLNEISKNYHLSHKEEMSENKKKWWADHHEENLRKLKERNLQSRYGLTLEQIDEMVIDQNHKCAICEVPLAETRRVIDHDHKTDKARGILCACCNAGLGMFRDDVAVMAKAIQYLKKHKGIP